MKFPLLQLYSMNRSQPIVAIGDKEVQWLSCNLDGYPPEREPGSMTLQQVFGNFLACSLLKIL